MNDRLTNFPRLQFGGSEYFLEGLVSLKGLYDTAESMEVEMKNICKVCLRIVDWSCSFSVVNGLVQFALLFLCQSFLELFWNLSSAGGGGFSRCSPTSKPTSEPSGLFLRFCLHSSIHANFNLLPDASNVEDIQCLFTLKNFRIQFCFDLLVRVRIRKLLVVSLKWK